MKELINIPNIISASRLLFSYIIFILLKNFKNNQYLIFINYLLCCYTDYLDGYFARKLNMQTTFGKFFDGFIDYLVTSILFILFYSRNLISVNNFMFLILIIIRDTIRNYKRINDMIRNKIDDNKISASYLGKISRVIQNIYLCIVILFPDNYNLIKSIFVYSSTLTSLVSFINYL